METTNGAASAAISDVMELFPDHFSYSDYTEHGFLVAFSAQAPPDALTRLTAPGIPVEVVEHVGHPLTEALEETAAMARQVKEVTGGTVGFSVAPFPQQGILTVMLSEGNDAVALERWVHTLSALRSPSGLRVVVEVMAGSPRAGVGTGVVLSLRSGSPGTS
jgi:hypothetical protein